MNHDATSLAGARFWVRPYDFEGDGSTGAAEDVASLEVGGVTRAFWLKTLENRLFFREIGRDENWNFGAIDELNDAEKSDLPLALANVLASESYGRVMLFHNESRPCFGLADPCSHVECLVPGHDLKSVRRWKISASYPDLSAHARDSHFMDWQPNSFYVDGLRTQIFDEFRQSLRLLPAPLVELRWIRGSAQELENILKSFLVYYWPIFSTQAQSVNHLKWHHATAWQMRESRIFFSCYFDSRSHGYDISHLYTQQMQWVLDAIIEHFVVIGQGEHKGQCYPYSSKGTVSAPTNHEILEAHLYLRDWINQKLPPAKAKKWLDFS